MWINNWKLQILYLVLPEMRLNRTPFKDNRGSLHTSISHWTRESLFGSPCTHNRTNLKCWKIRNWKMSNVRFFLANTNFDKNLCQFKYFTYYSIGEIFCIAMFEFYFIAIKNESFALIIAMSIQWKYESNKSNLSLCS